MSLSVTAGERVAIIGRNGVGKTTIVNTCLGVATLRSGTVAFAGKKQTRIRRFTAANNGVAIVPQGRRIIPGLTVRENLLLGAAVRRPGKWTLAAIFGLFPILEERAEVLGTALSGGQQQMLAIGRALMSNPDLLILDEPSEGLAPVIVEELAKMLRNLSQDGASILLIEQNFGLVRAVADRYYAVSKGTVIEAGALAGLSVDGLKRHVSV
jgi:branched-chain amino acid transport system ATP-binding protein